MKIIFLFLCTFSIYKGIKLNDKKTLKYEQSFIKTVKKPIQYFKGFFNSRSLVEINAEDLDIQYLYKNILLKLSQNRSEQFEEFHLSEPHDGKIEIQLHQHVDTEHEQKDHKLFEVKLEENDGKRQILITNDDQNYESSQKNVHIHYVRNIRDKESNDELYDYFLKSFEKILELFSTKNGDITSLLQNHLYSFLDNQGYEIERRVRSFKPQYEQAQILDIKGKETQEKYFEIFVYNIDRYFVGMQINTNNKVTEIKIPKNNLDDGFEKIKPQLEQICPKIEGQQAQEIEKYFGLSYDKKREIIIQQIADVCNSFEPNDKNLYDYPATAFMVNLTNEECNLSKSKIMVEQINNSFLQYIYLIFDNESFKSGYVLSPLAEDFENTIKKILQDSAQEIKEVSTLKQNGQESSETPTIDMIKQDILEVSKEHSVQLECQDIDSDSVQCKLNDVQVVFLAKINMKGVDYLKIQFFKKPEKNQKTSKIFNDVKIPIDNGFNLHKRIKPIAEEFFEHYKLRVQFNLIYQVSQKFQQLQNEKFFIDYFYLFTSFKQHNSTQRQIEEIFQRVCLWYSFS